MEVVKLRWLNYMPFVSDQQEAIVGVEMSGKGSGGKGTGGKSVTGGWTNSSGSTCTNYSDGAYRYTNPSGSSYYNTGNGHGFYNSGSSGTKSSGGQPYTTHYNYNKGYSSTKYN